MLKRAFRNNTEGIVKKITKNTRVHLVVFYNGDINFEFDRYSDVYVEEMSNVVLVENTPPVKVFLRMLYISKVALF